MSFKSLTEFENRVAEYFGAPFAVAVDSCTHGLEIALIATNAERINVPKRTYVSIPFLAKKLGLDLTWTDEPWKDYYFITDRIADAAVLWRKHSYVHGKIMGISFQYQKHLSLGRGGMLLLDDEILANTLRKMTYDGRERDIPWRDQDIEIYGGHYYMTPETAELGLSKLPEAIEKSPRAWIYEDWPDLTQMKVFRK